MKITTIEASPPVFGKPRLVTMQTATGAELDHLAELVRARVRRASQETDAIFRERLLTDWNRRMREGDAFGTPAIRVTPEMVEDLTAFGALEDEVPGLACDGQLGCGTCAGCRRYKGER